MTMHWYLKVKFFIAVYIDKIENLFFKSKIQKKLKKFRKKSKNPKNPKNPKKPIKPKKPSWVGFFLKNPGFCQPWLSGVTTSHGRVVRWYQSQYRVVRSNYQSQYRVVRCKYQSWTIQGCQMQLPVTDNSGSGVTTSHNTGSSE